MTLSAPEPVPATTISRVRRSSSVLNGLVCQDSTRLTSAERLPIQLNFSGSYCTPVLSSNGCIASPRANTPSVVPSLGAVVKMKFADRRLPAPAMFWTMTLGLPGRCLPRWRAKLRV